MMKMNSTKVRILCCIISLVLLAFCFRFELFAAEKPLAELYFYKHGTIDSIGLNPLDSTVYMTSTKNMLNNAGYNCYAYKNIPAGPKSSASVIRTLASDAIFMISAHANKGRVVCVDNSNGVTRVCANAQSASTAYSLQYNFDNTTNKLKSMRVAYWMGCNTYGDSTTYGSLNTKCAALGVDCVITHNNQTWPTYSSYFLYKFAVHGNAGKTVSAALAQAKIDTLSNFGYNAPYDTSSNCYKTVNSYKISGANLSPGQVKIKPAAYGTY